MGNEFQFRTVPSPVYALSVLESQLIARLREMRLPVVPVPVHHGLPAAIASHADLNLFDGGGGDLLLLRGAETQLADALRKKGFQIHYSSGKAGSTYPTDAMLDAAKSGDECFLNPATADSQVLALCRKKHLTLIPVRQGYTKCSMALLPEGSIITSDCSISRIAEKMGRNVLLVRTDTIQLPGYSCGLFGGTCGMIGDDLLVFAGDWCTHPDAAAISDFCRNLHVWPEALETGLLRDVGGICSLIPATALMSDDEKVEN